MCASYDEELTPDTDPPLIEPPPPATLLGRIFAHRRPPRTVVEAPLRIVARPVPPPAPPAVPPPDADPPPPADAREPGPPPAAVPEPAAEPAQAEPPEPAQARREPPPEPPAADRVASRYCPACRERVPLAADGRHCLHGHRLSPAHARRRLFFWRR